MAPWSRALSSRGYQGDRPEGGTDRFRRDDGPRSDRGERRDYRGDSRDGPRGGSRDGPRDGPRGGRDGRPSDRSDRPYRSNDRPDYRGDRDRPFQRSFQRDRFPSRRPAYDASPASEPAYGRYDGDHIYGTNPVLLALQAKRRKLSELLIQQDMDVDGKKDPSGRVILDLAQAHGLRIQRLSKHDLNMISDNRPHQGYILRAEPMEFVDLIRLPQADEYKVVLVLDEVADPQNFGALLRTAHFLGVDKVVACAKNSSPLSPVVSKASAGAMEVMQIYSTDNLMRFLDDAKADGWQVIGTHLDNRAQSMASVELIKPTVLVLGNEGHGIRTNVLNRCDHLIKIMGGDRQAAGTAAGRAAGLLGEVDSLNVSVTGGVILHHLMSAVSSRKE